MTIRDPVTDQPQRPSSWASLVAQLDKISHTSAGGQRQPWQDAGLPSDEGFFPEDYSQQVPSMDWFDPSMWQQADPNDPSTFDLGQIPASSGPVKEGKGMDFYRGGQAPSNYSNKLNPAYVARADFGCAVNKQIMALFKVEGTCNYYRKPEASDAAPGGRATNSDHLSAGAIDYTPAEGTSLEELDRLRNWLVTQPWVSFVRWRSESHSTHLHMSIDLGWVARNYFQSRQAPTLSNAPPPATSDQAAMRQRSAAEQAQVQPEAVAPTNPNDVRAV